MSKAHLEKFVTAVTSNTSLLQEASKGVDPEKQAAEFISNVVKHANGQGYDFTVEEARTWVAEQAKHTTGGELSDTQLEAVAGGKAQGGTVNAVCSKLAGKGYDYDTGRRGLDYDTGRKGYDYDTGRKR